MSAQYENSSTKDEHWGVVRLAESLPSKEVTPFSLPCVDDVHTYSSRRFSIPNPFPNVATYEY
jgi:hypothetical protein